MEQGSGLVSLREALMDFKRTCYQGFGCWSLVWPVRKKQLNSGSRQPIQRPRHPLSAQGGTRRYVRAFSDLAGFMEGLNFLPHVGKSDVGSMETE